MRLCVFLRAALAGSDDAGDDYGARWSGRRGGDPREGTDLERLLAAHRCGAAQRSGEWLEEAAGSPGGVAFWHTYRTILAERGAHLTSAPSLEYFARRIIPAPHPTSDETQRFFEENPTFLDHEFWQFFRVEGALPGSALFVWMYREDPPRPAETSSACTATTSSATWRRASRTCGPASSPSVWPPRGATSPPTTPASSRGALGGARTDARGNT